MTNKHWYLVTYIDENDMLISRKAELEVRPYIYDNNWLQMGTLSVDARHIRDLKIQEVTVK